MAALIDEILPDANVSLIRLALIHFWLVCSQFVWFSFLVYQNKK